MAGRTGQRETLRADGDPCRLSDKTAALFATVFAIIVTFLGGGEQSNHEGTRHNAARQGVGIINVHARQSA